MSGQLTARTIAGLKGKDTRYYVADGQVPGLRVAVYPSGARSFQVRLTIHGQRRPYTIGKVEDMTLREARDEAQRLIRDVRKGKDPFAVGRDGLTVRGLVTRFLDDYARPRKRSASEDERILERELVKRFGKMPAKDLQKAHVLQILHEARLRGVKGGQRNILASVRKALNWAVSVDLIDDNPARGIPQPEPVRPRERVLTRDELGAYWHLLPTASLDVRTRIALQVQALTACRIGEVTGARWIEVQLEQRKFVIPGSRMKAKQPHSIPITDALADLFEQARAVSSDSVYVFPSDYSDRPIQARSVVRALSRAQDHFGFAEKFTTHDLRRTAATTLIELGQYPSVVDRVLAHAPRDVLGVHYNVHGYGPEKLAALQLWGDLVLRLAAEHARRQRA